MARSLHLFVNERLQVLENNFVEIVLSKGTLFEK